MPTYDYECTQCKHRFEVFQQMSAKHIEKCPKCGKNVKRLISGGAGVIFKGSGFYATDYKNKSKPSSGGCPKTGDGCSSCPHAQ
jgi:putative FmdB family regulatory protein